MGICKCGKKVGASGKQCRRCVALNELGLKAGASEASIKSAYRKEIKAWHPDRYGKDKAGQVTAEERTKRINVSYEYLTSPSKKGDAPSSRRSAGASASPSGTKHGTGDSQQPPTESSATHTKRSRSSRQAVPNYPQRDFIAWKAAFDNLPMGRTKAAEGLKKWISHEAVQRTSAIAFAKDSYKDFGVEPNLKGFAKPEDARADVLRSLWQGSIPNLVERTNTAKSNAQFLAQMKTLKKSVDDFVKVIGKPGATIPTQDGGFHLSLDYVRDCCIHLSASLATASVIVKREYVQPLKLADCCIGLVMHLENTQGLSQAECHDLIKVALLAHGCTEEQVAPFDIGSVDRGSIRAKKEALAKKVLDSANVIAQVMQEIKRQNVRP